MAVALKSKNFQNPQELTKFVADAANNVTAGNYSIVYNTASNVYTLFWV
jgi:hypothetical protein